jgi:hypothetical protein
MASRFGDAEAEVVEEVGDAGEEADAHDGVLFGLFERGRMRAAGALALGFGLDDDGADLGEVRAVEVERAAAEELVAVVGGRIDAEGMVSTRSAGEVADVLADLGVVAAEEGAVAGERVDEVEDVARVLQASLVDEDVLAAWEASWSEGGSLRVQGQGFARFGVPRRR